jgi:flavin reductase (DIM6/NTAB) family NADH-FMN oxidoreductase RutF
MTKLIHFDNACLAKMPSRYKAKFVNSLSGFKSANLIGTQNINNQTNVAIFSSVFHLGASPALVGFVMRPDNGYRHTLDNIMATGHYTINQVSEHFYRNAHQTSGCYAKEQSEFIYSGLSIDYIDTFDAPFVKESPLKYAVKLKEIMPVSLNNTQLIIGEIIHVICEQKAIKHDGYIDIEALKTVSISGLDSYHTSQRLSRLCYAKPEQAISDITLEGLAKDIDELGSDN